MKKYIFIILLTIATFSAFCYAGSIYDDARQAGIDQYHLGNYSAAAKHFIAIQNIAPVNNDLGSWITRCNNKMVQSRNARIRKIKSSTVSKPIQGKGRKIERYDSIGHFGSSNLALVRFNNKYGFIDKDSLIVIPIQYDDIYAIITETVPGSAYDDFIKAWNIKWNWSWDKGQLMSVCRDGKWGYVNEKGEEVIPTVYDDVIESIVFKNRELIGVSKDDKYGFIDWRGNIIIPLEYDYVCRFYEGMCPAELKNDLAPVVKNGKMGFIDSNGRTVIEFEYNPQYNIDYAVPVMFRPVWHDGYTYLNKDGKYGIINFEGKSVTGFKYDGPANVNLINIGGKYKSYFEFPIGNNKAYFMDGMEYNSLEEFNQITVGTYRQESVEEDSDPIDVAYNEASQQYNKGNFSEAYLLLHDGIESGHIKSMLLGGLCILKQEPLSREDIIIAYGHISQAADKGDSQAQYAMGVMFENSLVPDILKTKKYSMMSTAKDFYKKSARQGNSDAIRRLTELGISSY